MSTIKELVNLKKVIDEACEDLAGRVTLKYVGKALICYHNHYEVPTFSIFINAGNRVEVFKNEDVVFSIDPAVDEVSKESIQNDIMEGLNQDVRC